MSNKDLLDAWEGEHLTEVALVAIADGQDAIVSGDARKHAESCDECAQKLADLALQSIAIGDALTSARARKLPARAVAVALALAVLGVLPSLLEPGWIADVANAPHTIPLFLAAISVSARTAAQAPAGVAATFAAAVLLVVSGVFVAKQRDVARSS